MSVSADTAILGLVSTPGVEPRNTLYYRRRLPMSGVCFGVCALLPHYFIVLKYDPDPAHKLIFDSLFRHATQLIEGYAKGISDFDEGVDG